MKWRINFSKPATKFIENNNIFENDVIDSITDSLKKFKGDKTTVDIKKLKGEWKNFYRIRKGKIRIIAEFNFDEHVVHIEKIDTRGDVYK